MSTIGNLFIIGTAGSGKTVLTAALRRYLLSQDISVISVNLDPAVKYLPYTCEVDVRDWVNIEDVISEYSLGPNGAMIVAADLVAQHIDDIADEVRDFHADAVLLDTAGQLEIFVYRQSGIEITKEFSKEKTASIFLMDSTLCKSASNFISLTLLASSAQLQLDMSMIFALTKSDLLEEDEINTLKKWSTSFNYVMDSMLEEDYSLRSDLTFSIIEAIQKSQTNLPMIPVSGLTGDGVMDIASYISRVWTSGDDWII